jgi:diaminohydroxyphosphoribosylaminopyrimidine deaminase/5-amino-6-(5-phosphoribosylamino)uracil reductase
VDTPIVPSYIQFLHIGFMDKVAKLQELHKLLLDKNICNVLIEGGAALNTSFIETNSVDEIITFICPSIITDSDSINVYESNSIQTIENKINLKLLECKIIEEDILLHYKVL